MRTTSKVPTEKNPKKIEIKVGVRITSKVVRIVAVKAPVGVIFKCAKFIDV